MDINSPVLKSKQKSLQAWTAGVGLALKKAALNLVMTSNNGTKAVA